VIEERVERCIDGDLTRAERVELLAHLVSHPEVLPAVGEIVVLEQRLGELKGAYDDVEPARAAPTTNVVRFARVPRWVSSPVFASAAAATLAIAATVGAMQWNADHRTAPRLYVVSIPFTSASDSVNWTKHVRLEQGQRMQLQVEGDRAPDRVHLRMQGADALNVQLEHSRTGRRHVSHAVNGGTTRYAALHEPKPGDTLVVENRGRTGVTLDLDALNADFVPVQADAGSGTIVFAVVAR
jgi:hypothetical protein